MDHLFSSSAHPPCSGLFLRAHRCCWHNLSRGFSRKHVEKEKKGWKKNGQTGEDRGRDGRRRAKGGRKKKKKRKIRELVISPFLYCFLAKFSPQNGKLTSELFLQAHIEKFVCARKTNYSFRQIISQNSASNSGLTIVLYVLLKKVDQRVLRFQSFNVQGYLRKISSFCSFERLYSPRWQTYLLKEGVKHVGNANLKQ